MTVDEAREEAWREQPARLRERSWQEFKAEIEADYSYPLPFGFEQTWNRAWDAAKRDDEQRIAALVNAVLAAHEFHPYGNCTLTACRLARALAGQSEETTSG